MILWCHADIIKIHTFTWIWNHHNFYIQSPFLMKWTPLESFWRALSFEIHGQILLRWLLFHPFTASSPVLTKVWPVINFAPELQFCLFKLCWSQNFEHFVMMLILGAFETLQISLNFIPRIRKIMLNLVGICWKQMTLWCL